MNILLDTLPETITVNGRAYFADTDFRTMIIFEKIIESRELTNRERIRQVIDLVLTDEQPAEIDLAVDEILYLYSCGKPAETRRARPKNGDVELKQRAIYDFEYDAPYIFSAFLSEYGIDLNGIEYLHWWKFLAMFESLPDDCKIVKIMGYRAADLSKIRDKDERHRLAKLKQIYAIPDNLDFEDKVALAGIAFGG